MKSTQIVRKTLLSAAVAAATVAAGQLSAAQIEEIIVTTQKREQSLQDVPITVSAFTGSFMEKAQISDAKAVALLTPGVSGDTDDSFLDSMNVRGISTNDFGVGAEPSIGVYQDGIYLGRTGGALASFFDLEMVEVVKGPQGTLFGRNASAGAIAVTTAKPTDEQSRSIDLGLGEDGYAEFTGVMNMPINDNLSSRMAIYHQQKDGWVKNINDGKMAGAIENTAARYTLAYESDMVSGTLMLEYEDRQGPPTLYQVFDPDETGISFYSTDAARNEISSDVNSDDLIDEGEVWGATLNVEVDLGNDYSLTSITGIRGHNYYYKEDFDGEDRFIFNYNQIQEQEYFSQEFRINRDTDAVSWFVGASMYQEEIKTRFNQTYDEDVMCQSLAVAYSVDYDADPDYVEGEVTDCSSYYYYNYGDASYTDPGVGTRNDSVDIDAEYDGWGVYGDATFHVSEKLDLSVGARYTEDNRDFGQKFGGEDRNYFFYSFPFFSSDFLRGSDSWSNTSVRTAVSYQLSDEVSTYVNYSTGYKAGGFNTFFVLFPDAVDVDSLDGEDAVALGGSPEGFAKEEVTNIELGLKGQFWDGQMQLNASIYQYQFDGMQSGYYVGSRYSVANVGDAEGNGVELDMRLLPSDNLDIYLGLSWADTELTKPAAGFCEPADCLGAQIPGTVEFSAAMVATYTVPMENGDIAVTWETFHQDEGVGFGQFDLNPLMADGFTTSNLRIGYDSAEDWSVTLWVNNITDEFHYKGVAGADSNIAPHYFGFSEPRRMGLDVGFKF
ncbi:MAG: TonB-dependent receptor [Porticoccaceae bacterium]|nr:TonB-dependent receptor [Porticoccaceae bacterium]